MSLLYLLPMLLLYTNLPPATWQIQPVPVNGKTPYTEQCSGDDSSPLQPRRGAGPVSNTTRLVERNHPRHVIPTEMKWSGGIFPSCKFYNTQDIIAALVDSSAPFHSARNDIVERWYHSSAQVIFGAWRAADCRPY